MKRTVKKLKLDLSHVRRLTSEELTAGVIGGATLRGCPQDNSFIDTCFCGPPTLRVSCGKC